MLKDLAVYYDQLVLNDEARDLWVTFTKEHMKEGRILEYGSGTGEISLVLAKNYPFIASDISECMLNQLKKKEGAHHFESIRVLDMRSDVDLGSFDTILSYCDTFNYLKSYEELKSVLKNTYQRLKKGGKLLFDLHSLDRLNEFEDLYQEIGLLETGEYRWTIQAKEDIIYQNFEFNDEEGTHYDSFVQKVFNPNEVLTIMEDIGFKVKVFTDFVEPGINPGEKIFFVGEKR